MKEKKKKQKKRKKKKGKNKKKEKDFELHLTNKSYITSNKKKSPFPKFLNFQIGKKGKI